MIYPSVITVTIVGNLTAFLIRSLIPYARLITNIINVYVDHARPGGRVYDTRTTPGIQCR